MGTTRLFCCPIKEGLLPLAGAELHHGLHVLRLRAGEEVEVFDGAGHVGYGRVQESGKRELSVLVDEVRFIGRNERGIVIGAAVAKGDRFDWLVSKCTELGVDRICPVVFERTVKLARGEKLVERYEKLAMSAAKQCGRLWLPRIDGPMSLREFLETMQAEGAVVLYGLPSADRSLFDGQIGETAVAAVVGPEGGFTETEQEMLDACGAQAVRLTDTVLRIETAAVAMAVGLCMMRCGAAEG
ncbi:MAG: 16S rRNA (uracil(1498)-N(3))-methyltransferase [Sedimentisphaerales bacterium]|nr:16S rRNA (uracil(1498)-N(3))-methyltransferase [Sedimentisphaerales bacterium]